MSRTFQHQFTQQHYSQQALLNCDDGVGCHFINPVCGSQNHELFTRDYLLKVYMIFDKLHLVPQETNLVRRRRSEN